MVTFFDMSMDKKLGATKTGLDSLSVEQRKQRLLARARNVSGGVLTDVIEESFKRKNEIKQPLKKVEELMKIKQELNSLRKPEEGVKAPKKAKGIL